MSSSPELHRHHHAELNPFGPLRTIQVRGAMLDYCDNGAAAPAIVFVHGGLTDLRVWHPHRVAIGTRYRTIAYTQRYHGAGPWGEGWPRYGVNTHSSDLVALLEALEVGPVHLVAWSYAGHVAFDAALRRPGLFRSLFVYEPGFATYVVEQSARDAAQQDAMAAFGPAFACASAGDITGALRLMVGASGQSADYFDSQPDRVRAIQMENARTIPELLFRQEAPPHITCEQLACLRVPAAVARGADSRPMYAIVSEAAQRCIGGSSHLVVPGRNHMWPDEDPAGFVEALLGFIRRLAQ